jgi:hypothetical protein
MADGSTATDQTNGPNLRHSRLSARRSSQDLSNARAAAIRAAREYQEANEPTVGILGPNYDQSPALQKKTTWSTTPRKLVTHEEAEHKADALEAAQDWYGEFNSFGKKMKGAVSMGHGPVLPTATLVLSKDEPTPEFADRLYGAKTNAWKANAVSKVSVEHYERVSEKEALERKEALQASMHHRGQLPGYIVRRRSNAGLTEESARQAAAAAVSSNYGIHASLGKVSAQVRRRSIAGQTGENARQAASTGTSTTTSSENSFDHDIEESLRRRSLNLDEGAATAAAAAARAAAVERTQVAARAAVGNGAGISVETASRWPSEAATSPSTSKHPPSSVSPRAPNGNTSFLTPPTSFAHRASPEATSTLIAPPTSIGRLSPPGQVALTPRIPSSTSTDSHAVLRSAGVALPDQALKHVDVGTCSSRSAIPTTHQALNTSTILPSFSKSPRGAASSVTASLSGAPGMLTQNALSSLSCSPRSSPRSSEASRAIEWAAAAWSSVIALQRQGK